MMSANNNNNNKKQLLFERTISKFGLFASNFLIFLLNGYKKTTKTRQSTLLLYKASWFNKSVPNMEVIFS